MPRTFLLLACNMKDTHYTTNLLTEKVWWQFLLPMTSRCNMLLVRNRKKIASEIKFRVKCESFKAFTMSWCNACSIYAAIIFFDFVIADRMANVPFTLVVSSLIIRVTFAWIWIDAETILAFLAATRYTHVIAIGAHFKAIDTNASILFCTDTIDAVADLNISSVAIC